MSKKPFNYSKQFNKKEEELPKPMQEQPVQEPEVPQTPVQEQQPVIRKGAVVNCERLNVREGCTKESDVVSIISKGTIVDVIDERGNADSNEIRDWYEIETANGKIKGYCMAEFIELR